MGQGSKRAKTLKERARKTLPPWMRKRLAAGYRKLSILRFRPRTVRHVYAGVPLDVFLADPIAEEWYDRDHDEPGEIRLLKKSRLKPGALVFDLGAHQCVMAMMLANSARPGGRVIALEASPHDARVGETNCRANGYEDVQILNAAVTERSGTVTFARSGHVDLGQNAGANFEVSSYSIDDLAQRFGVPEVIYMDIEGYECRALAGAPKLLQHKIDWFVEVHVNHGLESFGGSAEGVLGFFPRESYDRYIAGAEDPIFVAFESDDLRLQDRFYLVAVHR